MKDTTEEIRRILFDVESDIDDAAISLDMLPSIIQVYIFEYGLDKLNKSESDIFNFSHSANLFYDLLVLIQQTIWRLKDDREAIFVKHRNNQEKASDAS